MQRLFVYGTLAPGKENHHLLENLPGSWNKVSIIGKLLDKGWGSELNCPGIVLSSEGQEVKGYVFSSSDLSDYWPILDEFEGGDYQRVQATIKTEDNKEVLACVYILDLS